MVEEKPPGVLSHGSPLAGRDFERLDASEASQHLLNSDPRNEHHRTQHDHATGDHEPAANPPNQEQQEQKQHFNGEADNPSAGSREQQRHNRDHGEECHQEKSLAAHLPQNQWHERHRDHHLRKSRKMVAIHVRTERQSAETHLPKPIEFSVECQVLKNGKD